MVAKIDGTNPTVSFKAENIRKAKTGIHARVEVYSGPHLLGYDVFNVERHADRVRLANACETKAFPKDIMRSFLDDFCALIWPTWVTQYAPKKLIPNPTNMKETQYALDPYVVEDGGTIIFAPGGSGKSYMALLMAQSMNTGNSGIWRCRKLNVLYLNLERSAKSLERRLMLVNEALGLPIETPMLMSNARGKTLAHVAESMDTDAFDVVVVDSLSRSGAGSLVDDEAANSVMDTVNALASTWIILAHTPRSDSEHEFGSVMFGNAADLTIMLKSVKNEAGVLGVQLKGMKSNDVPTPSPKVYAMSWDKYGLSGFRTAAASEFPGLADGEDLDRGQIIREYLLDVGEASIADICAQTGLSRSTAQRELESGHTVGRRKDGRTILYSIRAVS